MFRKSLLAAMIGAISLAHAADWNAETLATARQQVEAEINQYLRDGSGPIARFANADIRTWREHAKYGKGKKGEPRTFAHLQNGGELLAKIAASAPYEEKIRFLALLASAPSVRNSMGAYLNDNLALYEAIMEDDRNNAAFALAALAKIQPDLDEQQQQTYRNLRQRFGFNLDNVSVDNNQDKPQICAEFSDIVLAEPLQDWRKRITITPAAEGEARYSGDKICYNGVWQRDYKIRIDPKLTAQNHLELGRAEERTISTGDREPMVRFATRGKTLVLDPDAALTVESSNVDTIELELWQIPDNNLAGDAHDAIDNPEYFNTYDLDANASKIWSGSFNPEKSERNSVVQNRIAFADMAGKETRSGVYVLTVRAKDQYENALLGFTVTDQGLTAYQTPDGLLAELRDLLARTGKEEGKMLAFVGAARMEDMAAKKADNLIAMLRKHAPAEPPAQMQPEAETYEPGEDIPL